MVRSDQNLPRRHWSTFVLDNPPLRLYRIHYDGAGTLFNWNGFQARSQGDVSDYSNWELHQRLKRHLNWTRDSECESPMISTFGGITHARHWAQKWAERHRYGRYYIATIEVDGTFDVFRSVEFVNILDIPLSGTVKTEHLRDEYLIFGGIDMDNILEFEDEDGDFVHPSNLA